MLHVCVIFNEVLSVLKAGTNIFFYFLNRECRHIFLTQKSALFYSFILWRAHQCCSGISVIRKTFALYISSECMEYCIRSLSSITHRIYQMDPSDLLSCSRIQIFCAPSFDDKILEVVAVFGSMQMAVSRVIKLQHHRIAQVSLKIFADAYQGCIYNTFS